MEARAAKRAGEQEEKDEEEERRGGLLPATRRGPTREKEQQQHQHQQHQPQHHPHYHHGNNEDAFSSSSSSSSSSPSSPSSEGSDSDGSNITDGGEEEPIAGGEGRGRGGQRASDERIGRARAPTTATASRRAAEVSEWDRAMESAGFGGGSGGTGRGASSSAATASYRRAAAGPAAFLRQEDGGKGGGEEEEYDEEEEEEDEEEDRERERSVSSPISATQTIISDGGGGGGRRGLGEVGEGEEAEHPSIEVVPSYDDSGAPSLETRPAPRRHEPAGPPPPPSATDPPPPQPQQQAPAPGGPALAVPDVLAAVRLKIDEGLQLFDSDLLGLAAGAGAGASARAAPAGGSAADSDAAAPPASAPAAAPAPAPAAGGHRAPPSSRPSPSSAAPRRLRPADRYYQLPGPAGLSPRADEQQDEYEEDEEDDAGYRDSLKRSSQQSISAAVLVSLAHKRNERRRLAAMEMEKICRSLLYQNEAERIRAILLLLCDDYVRSTSEDARKGGVVALAACAIALKRAGPPPAAAGGAGGAAAPDPSSSAAAAAAPPAGGGDPVIEECRDLILASVVHACQDHSSRVRYYATESLYNVVKVMPSMAVQHFFILFEILRSLCADVDADVRSGADLLDRKLKEVVVAAMNAGAFSADACLPVFCRFVHARHKPTKRLTLSWLQELNSRLADPAPILEFLHLFLGGVFDMAADPSPDVRDAAVLFLQTVLPKFLAVPEQDGGGGEGDLTDAIADADTSTRSFSSSAKVDYDKILQSLVTTMEHPDPFVRKVAMYWVSRIVKAHCDVPPAFAGGSSPPFEIREEEAGAGAAASNSPDDERDAQGIRPRAMNHRQPPSSPPLPQQQELPPLHPPPPPPPRPSPACLSVRIALPHILPGILLSIGDDYKPDPKKAKGSTSVAAGPAGSGKDSFLADITTRALAEQTNETLQAAVRRDGPAYVPYLDGFIVALREELDAPGEGGGGQPPSSPLPTGQDNVPARSAAAAGLTTVRYPPPVERTPYRVDVKQDGTGIESPGWFSSPSSAEATDKSQGLPASTVMSRLCALDWVVVLYESVVPILLKADYAKEFVHAIIHQFDDNPPRSIVHKSLEVLAKITVPAPGEAGQRSIASPSAAAALVGPKSSAGSGSGDVQSAPTAAGRSSPMNENNISFAFDILEPSHRVLLSRNRDVFAILIQLYSDNMCLMDDLSSVVAYMCHLQPPEFVFVSFSVELDRFISRKASAWEPGFDASGPLSPDRKVSGELARDLKFVSSFIQSLNHSLLNKPEAKRMRDVLRDCVRGSAGPAPSERDRQRARLFHIMLHSFAHNLAAAVSLCFWAGAYRTANLVLSQIDPLDISLIFLLEIDRFIELLERPLLRHLHVRMLEIDLDPNQEGSGSMLFKALKSVLMMLPQSTCYRILRERMVGVSRFRQSAFPALSPASRVKHPLTSNAGVANDASVGPGLGSDGCSGIGGGAAAAAKNSPDAYVSRVLEVRAVHCATAWSTIRSESLELAAFSADGDSEAARDAAANRRREWLGYENADEEAQAHEARRKQASARGMGRQEESSGPKYSDLSSHVSVSQAGLGVSDVESRRDCEETALPDDGDRSEPCADECNEWKRYWETQV